MKIKDIENINKNFIIKIPKNICEEKGINVKFVGGNSFPNRNCEWWQELEDYHEISLNKYWALPMIEKYNLTDDEIEIYFTEKVKIKLEYGKCGYCNRGKRKYKQIEVIRINPWTQRADIEEGHIINPNEYEIVNNKKRILK